MYMQEAAAPEYTFHQLDDNHILSGYVSCQANTYSPPAATLHHSPVSHHNFPAHRLLSYSTNNISYHKRRITALIEMAAIAAGNAPAAAIDGPLPQPLPLTAEMLAEISMPAPWYNVPDFNYEPKHGSHGVPPLELNRNSVSATSVSGGFLQSNDPFGDDSNLTLVEQTNIARLATVVWGSNCKLAVTDLLRGNLSTSLDRQIDSMVGDRIAATESNTMYFMVQETVESWNLGVSIKNLARIAVRARVPMAGEDQVAIARRENIANAYQAATFDIRSRAIAAINDAMSRVSSKYPGKRGQVLAIRLKAVRNKFSVHPFLRLNPNMVEPLYFEQTRDAKRQFWLNRFNENAVAWFWDFCGVMNIRESIGQQPFGNYCREEFAFVCDTMWSSIIGINVEKANCVQSGSVAERALDAYLITKIDQLSYRQHIGIFNEMYNSTHPRAQVRSLGLIYVLEGSIGKPKGFHKWVSQQYIAEVERKMANATADERSI
jgi:hypothetical protein